MEKEAVIKVIGDYWDEYSAKFDSEHDTENESAWMDTLEELLGGDKRKNVLDLGTGTGFLANMTARLGYPSVGIDLSTDMMRHAVRHATADGSAAIYMSGNALELPLMDGTVDAIVNARLIWTIIEPDDMLREWLRVLRPGGKLLCFNRMEDGVGLTSCKGSTVYAGAEIEDALAVREASMDELRTLLERGGFENIEIRRLPGLTRPEFDYQCWYVLMGEKPRDPKLEAELGMAAFWDRSAPEYDAAHRLSDPNIWARTLLSLAGENAEQTVLDVATGTGMLANALGTGGYKKVIGCDISSGMLRFAKQHARETDSGVSFQYGNAEALPYPDNSFDVVFNARLLWTLEDPSAALSEWLRVLKSGGRVIALNELENGSVNCGELGSYISETGGNPFPFSNASDQNLIAAFEHAGFRSVRVDPLPGCRTVGTDHNNWYAFSGIKA